MKIRRLPAEAEAGVAVAILVLVNFGAAHLTLGPMTGVVAIGIALAEGLVVLLVLMKLRTETPLIRLVGAAGFAWLVVMFVLTAGDVLTR